MKALHPDRDRFLAEQATLLGEPIRAFTLARVLTGPPLGAPLVFLMIGTSSLHLVPAPGDKTLFGIALPETKTVFTPSRRTFSRFGVTYGPVKPSHWWAALTAPRDVVFVEVPGTPERQLWQFQLTAAVPQFLEEWNQVWSL